MILNCARDPPVCLSHSPTRVTPCSTGKPTAELSALIPDENIFDGVDMTDGGSITALGDRVRTRLAADGAGEALNLSLVICNAGVLNIDKILDEGGLDYKSIEQQIQVSRLQIQDS